MTIIFSIIYFHMDTPTQTKLVVSLPLTTPFLQIHIAFSLSNTHSTSFFLQNDASANTFNLNRCSITICNDIKITFYEAECTFKNYSRQILIFLLL